MEEEKKEIIIRTGDKVIIADGRVGVISRTDSSLIEFSDGTEYRITNADYENGFSLFYMIGKNIFGNKIGTDEIERRIAQQTEIVRAETLKLHTLRKQLWTLNERMVHDWREREEVSRKAAEERRAQKSAEQTDVEKSPEQNA